MPSRKPATAPRCRETLASGEPCPNPARAGESVCGTHGARVEADRAKTRAQKDAFLAAYKETASVTAGCAAAGLKSRSTYYSWLVTDGEFSLELDHAKAECVDSLRSALITRGRDGIAKAVWYKGQVAGYVREFDTTAAIFAARALAPHEFRERVEVVNISESPEVLETLKVVLTTFCQSVNLDIDSPEIRVKLAQAFRAARKVQQDA